MTGTTFAKMVVPVTLNRKTESNALVHENLMGFIVK